MAKDKKRSRITQKEILKETEPSHTSHKIFTPARLIVMFLIIEIFIILLMKNDYYIEHHKTAARKAAKEQRYDVAKKHYLKLLKTAPDSATVNLELGNTYWSLGEYDNAIKHLALALENSSQPIPGVNSRIGQAYLKKGDTAKALEYFKREYAINPRDPFANFYLGTEKFKEGNYQEAAKYFQVIVHDDRFKDKLKEYWQQIESKVLAELQTIPDRPQ
ncbi:MAG: tetratricopeptide repeat protein [Candidatus Sumerlaeia bacterium]|nr:tetratricopeptide repeat protein [Candidatus Sumerlaeia bacterium]